MKNKELFSADFDTRFIYVQNVQPSVDAGIYPIKRRLGDAVRVSAEVLQQGHDGLCAALQYRYENTSVWQEIPMDCENKGLDIYTASFDVEKIGRYDYRVVGYTDFFANWCEAVEKKFQAGEDVASEVIEGQWHLEDCVKRAKKSLSAQLKAVVDDVQSMLSSEDKYHRLVDLNVRELAAQAPDRDSFNTGESKVFSVRVDRRKAEYAAWYEVFPRSCASTPGEHGTFNDVKGLLPYIDDMGFDVLYFTPIHPIGLSKRKGRNNSLMANENDPGSPYAIGSEAGGHFSVHPELGTLDDFDNLVKACGERDIEIALDFALNCSPDHPYLKEHPDWFYKRPDGSIKYAENPPKKYEDIYPLNFECADRKNLWAEIRDIFLFWASHGVRIFRVDNPHTKPITFWQWCITEVHKTYPDVIFLSEAFTRPRLMELLAKNGYTQSYTYFTWRETKAELTEYFEYLNDSPAAEYMIGNIFATTPDILPKHLQHAPDQMFRIRHALAATLSPVYGMYSGYELCENIPVGPRDELMDSEKYELTSRNFEDPQSIAPFIKKINHIRRENPALQVYKNLTFCEVNNEKIIAYLKHVEGNTLLVVVNLDPWNSQSGMLNFPLHVTGFSGDQKYNLHDLMTDSVYSWQGAQNFVELDASAAPVHIFRIF